ncbi:hypothetical protein RHGRI_029563 [Rhododendron griersonianum]|uniref:Uncharacterized protein n=1 Tax=Rhododendron griersonianum TaxID=479676 RepID=A0AAV6IPM3_9ERIC|nr:hypothetical protein RHGRI_029563 [Rhododendron griersonianum]
MWNNRFRHVVPDGDVDLPDSVAYLDNDTYVLWYNRITIRYVSRLGAATDIAYGLFERLRTMDPLDLDVVRNIGDQGVACLDNLEKWLRKRPPIKLVAKQQNGGNEEEQLDDLVEPQNVASGTEQGHPDATPMTSTEGTATGSVQDGSGSLHEGGGTGGAQTTLVHRSTEKRKKFDGDHGFGWRDATQLEAEFSRLDGNQSIHVQIGERLRQRWRVCWRERDVENSCRDIARF